MLVLPDTTGFSALVQGKEPGDLDPGLSCTVRCSWCFTFYNACWTGLVHGTIEVYVSAISSCHIGFYDRLSVSEVLPLGGEETTASDGCLLSLTGASTAA